MSQLDNILGALLFDGINLFGKTKDYSFKGAVESEEVRKYKKVIKEVINEQLDDLGHTSDNDDELIERIKKKFDTL